MTETTFHTPSGMHVPALSAQQMRRVDNVAVEDVGLELLQMMENAGRGLAWHVHDAGKMDVIIVAGNGGNGGGGLACARHLTNRDRPVQIVLDRPPRELTGASAHQLAILKEMGIPIHTDLEVLTRANKPFIAVDALIGYGLAGEVRPPTRRYIQAINQVDASTISLDVPSGIDASTGATHGVGIEADLTVTLALPKTGLAAVEGRIVLVDIGIPSIVYERLDIAYANPFDESDWVAICCHPPSDGQ